MNTVYSDRMDAQPINEKHEARALMPAIAWPTLAYGVVIAVLHWSLVWAGLTGRIGLVWLVIPLGLTTYAHYTLVHESVHKNIVAGYRSLDWVHHAIGWYGSLVLFSSWPLLERTHKNHHSHVNTDKDPDIYVKRSLRSLIVRNILSWALQIFPIQLLRLVFTDRSLAKGRPIAPAASDGLMPMMSACWAASRSMRGPPPPISSGGRRTGIGRAAYPEIR